MAALSTIDSLELIIHRNLSDIETSLNAALHKMDIPLKSALLTSQVPSELPRAQRLQDYLDIADMLEDYLIMTADYLEDDISQATDRIKNLYQDEFKEYYLMHLENGGFPFFASPTRRKIYRKLIEEELSRPERIKETVEAYTFDFSYHRLLPHYFYFDNLEQMQKENLSLHDFRTKLLYRTFKSLAREKHYLEARLDEVKQANRLVYTALDRVEDLQCRIDFVINVHKIPTRMPVEEINQLCIDVLTSDMRLNTASKRLRKYVPPSRMSSPSSIISAGSHEDSLAVDSQQKSAFYVEEQFSKEQIAYLCDYGLSSRSAKLLLQGYDFEAIKKNIEGLNEVFVVLNRGRTPTRQVINKHPHILNLQNGQFQQYCAAIEELFSHYEEKRFPSGIFPKNTDAYADADKIKQLIPKRQIFVDFFGLDIITLEKDREKTKTLLSLMPFANSFVINRTGVLYRACVRSRGDLDGNYRKMKLAPEARVLFDLQKVSGIPRVEIIKYFQFHHEYEKWYSLLR